MQNLSLIKSFLAVWKASLGDEDIHEERFLNRISVPKVSTPNFGEFAKTAGRIGGAQFPQAV